MRDPFEHNRMNFGQMAFAIALGRKPDQTVLDNLRYLRQLGVPYAPGQTPGSGHWLQYGFNPMFECAFGLEWLKWGLRPRQIAQISIEERKHVLGIGRRALEDLDEDLILGTALAPGERLAVDPAHELFAVLDKGREGREYTYSLVEATPEDPYPKPGLIYDDLSSRGAGLYTPSVPLYRLVGTLLIHARNAPVTRPGRK